MKFVLGKAELVREQLKGFGSYYFKVFTSPSVSLLVLCMNDDNVIAACSIGGTFNMAALCVKEGYHGQGIGTQTFKKAITLARKRGMNFFTGAVPPDNVAALRMDFKVGFKVIKRFEDFFLVMLPLNFKGKLTYTFLHLVSRLLPDPFVTKAYYTAVWIYKRTLSRRP